VLVTAADGNLHSLGGMIFTLVEDLHLKGVRASSQVHNFHMLHIFDNVSGDSFSEEPHFRNSYSQILMCQNVTF